MRSIAGDDDLVGVRNVKVVAQQFTDQIGVGVFWIEQFDAIGDTVAFSPELGQLRLTMFQLLARIRPCADARRSDQGESRKCNHRANRRNLPQSASARPRLGNHAATAADQTLVAFRCLMAGVSCIVHDLQENHTKALESSGFARFCLKSANKCGEQRKTFRLPSPTGAQTALQITTDLSSR